jgi:hypothetical protein
MCPLRLLGSAARDPPVATADSRFEGWETVSFARLGSPLHTTPRQPDQHPCLVGIAPAVPDTTTNVPIDRVFASRGIDTCET